MNLNTLQNILSHYILFGNTGIKFLIKKRFKKNELLEIKLKGYKHTIYMRNDTSDIIAFDQVLFKQEYEIVKYKIHYQPETIIDCGANIGLTSIYFATLYPNAKIIAVEPEIGNFNLLLKNTHSYPNIICLNYGIWNKNTNLEVINSDLGNWAFTVNEVYYEDSNTIKAITIDRIMEDYNLKKIDLLKLDIEGTEKEIFENNYDQWLSRTKFIVAELHDNLKEDCSKTFFKALANYSYKLYNNGELSIIEMN